MHALNVGRDRYGGQPLVRSAEVSPARSAARQKSGGRLGKDLLFAAIGFCIVWVLASAGYCSALHRAAGTYSDAAVRFRTEQPLEADAVRHCVSGGAVLYCDLGEQSNLRGIWQPEGTAFRLPLVQGRALTPAETQDSPGVAVVGATIAAQASGQGAGQIIVGDSVFEICGIAGVAETATPLDDLILLPLQQAYALLAPMGRPLEYVLDGSRHEIERALTALQESGVEVERCRTDGRYAARVCVNSEGLHGMYLTLAGVVSVLMILFTLLEVQKKSADIEAYLACGATVRQAVGRLFAAALRSVVLSFFAGCLAGWVVWSISAGQQGALLSLLAGAMIGVGCATAAASFAVWSLLRKKSDGQGVWRWTTKLIPVALVAASSFVLVFANILSLASIRQNAGQTALETLAEQEFRQLIRADDSPRSFNELLTDRSTLARLKDFSRRIAGQDQHVFLACSEQFLQTTGSAEQSERLPAAFYADGVESEGMPALNAVQVSANFFELMGLQPAAGRLLEPSDYRGDALEMIPVVLGAAYAEFFDLGARLENLRYLSSSEPLEVVGFLPAGACYMINGFPYPLDYQIVMPSLEYEDDPAYGSPAWEHQTWVYLQKLEGYFRISGDADRVAASLLTADLGARCGLPMMHLGGSFSNEKMPVLVALSGRYTWATQTAVWLTGVLALLLFIQHACCYFEAGRTKWDVLKISGATFGQLLWQISKGSLPIVITSNIVAWFLTVLAGLPYAWWVAAVSAACVLLCVAVCMARTVSEECIA